MKTLVLIAMLAASLNTFAGDKGNGGYSVVCRDNGGPITSAELLDVYEGRILYRKTFAVDQNSVDEIIKIALERLKSYALFSTKILKELELIEKNIVYIPAGNELELTDDAFPKINKTGCKFEQLANYTNEGELFVSQEIFDHLDNINKAGLFLHEAIYSIRRKALGDKTSAISRRLVAQLLSTNPDKGIIEHWVHDSLYRPNNKRPCGLKGSIEERIESCSFVNGPNYTVVLVTRTADLKEVWLDHSKRLLWSDRLYQFMNFEGAIAACSEMLPEMGGIERKWRLPTSDNYANSEYLFSMLPNTGNNWFWTSTLRGKLVLIYNGADGSIGFNPFKGNKSGSVRCVATY